MVHSTYVRWLPTTVISVLRNIHRHYGHDNSYKGEHLIGWFTVRSSVRYHDGGTWRVQADMVLEKELRILHL